MKRLKDPPTDTYMFQYDSIGSIRVLDCFFTGISNPFLLKQSLHSGGRRPEDGQPIYVYFLIGCP